MTYDTDMIKSRKLDEYVLSPKPNGFLHLSENSPITFEVKLESTETTGVEQACQIVTVIFLWWIKNRVVGTSVERGKIPPPSPILAWM